MNRRTAPVRISAGINGVSQRRAMRMAQDGLT